MESEKRSEASLEVESDTKHLLRNNRLAKISMYIAIVTTIGGICVIPLVWDYYLETLIFLLFLVSTSAGGAFFGHCAYRQLRVRRPHQKGKAMAVIGIIGCYLCCIGWGLFLIWLLHQQTV